jgi:hypothetical protein
MLRFRNVSSHFVFMNKVLKNISMLYLADETMAFLESDLVLQCSDKLQLPNSTAKFHACLACCLPVLLPACPGKVAPDHQITWDRKSDRGQR